MNDTEAFLRKIRENPDDDAPRLVFADYLDEQAQRSSGKEAKEQAKWAALIRAGIAKERESTADASLWNKWAGVSISKGSLLARQIVPKSLQKNLGKLNNRGFFDRLNLTLNELINGTHELLDSPAPIRSLCLQGISGGWHRIEGNPVLSLIRELDLSLNALVTDEDLEGILNDPQLQFLSSLDLWLIHQKQIPLLKKNKNLRSLRRLGVLFLGDDKAERELLDSPLTENLEELYGNSKGLFALAKSRSPLAKTLRFLEIEHDREISTKKMKWGQFQNLQFLNLTARGNTDWITPFLESQDLKTINRVRVTGSAIPPTILNHFEHGENELTLELDHLSQPKLKQILSSPTMERVKSLSLIGNIDLSVQLLAQHSTAINLRSLTLSGNLKDHDTLFDTLSSSNLFANLLFLSFDRSLSLQSLRKIADSQLGQSLRGFLCLAPQGTKVWQTFLRNETNFPHLVHFAFSHYGDKLRSNLIADGRKKLKLT